MSGVLVGSVTNVGHEVHTLELPADTIVDTLGLTPALSDLDISVTLVAKETLGALLHDLRVSRGSDGHAAGLKSGSETGLNETVTCSLKFNKFFKFLVLELSTIL